MARFAKPDSLRISRNSTRVQRGRLKPLKIRKITAISSLISYAKKAKTLEKRSLNSRIGTKMTSPKG